MVFEGHKAPFGVDQIEEVKYRTYDRDESEVTIYLKGDMGLIRFKQRDCFDLIDFYLTLPGRDRIIENDKHETDLYAVFDSVS